MPQSGKAQQAATKLSAEMQPFVRTDAPIVVLRHVTPFDGTGSPAKPDQAVAIDHGRIAAIGSDASVVTPDDATVLDERGKTLLPGLVGMHEHLFFPKVGGPLILATDLDESAPRMYLSARTSSYYGKRC